ncbi:MAG: carboxymuconolactone decarboxylase family protein [Geminicoccaceae bacterium]
MDEAERYKAGSALRRELLGEEHVARSERHRNAFNEDFHDLLTRHEWGEIWTRPGLPRQTRSCVTLGMLVARGEWDEFRVHLRAAFASGLTREEIKEVLLQAAVYCGVPAAHHGFRIAEEVFARAEVHLDERR